MHLDDSGCLRGFTVQVCDPVNGLLPEILYSLPFFWRDLVRASVHRCLRCILDIYIKLYRIKKQSPNLSGFIIPCTVALKEVQSTS